MKRLIKSCLLILLCLLVGKSLVYCQMSRAQSKLVRQILGDRTAVFYGKSFRLSKADYLSHYNFFTGQALRLNSSNSVSKSEPIMIDSCSIVGNAIYSGGIFGKHEIGDPGKIILPTFTIQNSNLVKSAVFYNMEFDSKAADPLEKSTGLKLYDNAIMEFFP